MYCTIIWCLCEWRVMYGNGIVRKRESLWCFARYFHQLNLFQKIQSSEIKVLRDSTLSLWPSLFHRDLKSLSFLNYFWLLLILTFSGPTKFDWPLGIRMFREITTGIKVLHDSTPSLFHRDLKSLNVLVTSDLHCRVADFGLSRFVVDENTITLGKCRGMLFFFH